MAKSLGFVGVNVDFEEKEIGECEKGIVFYAGPSSDEKGHVYFLRSKEGSLLTCQKVEKKNRRAQALKLFDKWKPYIRGSVAQKGLLTGSSGLDEGKSINKMGF